MPILFHAAAAADDAADDIRAAIRHAASPLRFRCCYALLATITPYDYDTLILSF